MIMITDGYEQKKAEQELFLQQIAGGVEHLEEYCKEKNVVLNIGISIAINFMARILGDILYDKIPQEQQEASKTILQFNQSRPLLQLSVAKSLDLASSFGIQSSHHSSPVTITARHSFSTPGLGEYSFPRPNFSIFIPQSK